MPDKDQLRYVREQAELKADIAANDAIMKKIKLPDVEPLLRFANELRRTTWPEIPMYAVDDFSRSVQLIIGDRKEVRNDLAGKVKWTEDTKATPEEIATNVRGFTSLLKARGSVEFRNVISGGEVDKKGKFRFDVPRNLTFATEVFPFNLTLPDKTSASGGVTIPSWLNFVFDVLDEDDAVTDILIRKAIAANEGRPQMSADAKRAAFATLRPALLEAERQLEAALRHAEAQGVEVKRDCWRPEVLLWLGTTSILKAAPTSKPEKDPDNLTAADFEFEGDADEMSPDEIAKHVAAIADTLPDKVA